MKRKIEILMHTVCNKPIALSPVLKEVNQKGMGYRTVLKLVNGTDSDLTEKQYNSLFNIIQNSSSEAASELREQITAQYRELSEIAHNIGIVDDVRTDSNVGVPVRVQELVEEVNSGRTSEEEDSTEPVNEDLENIPVVPPSPNEEQDQKNDSLDDIFGGSLLDSVPTPKAKAQDLDDIFGKTDTDQSKQSTDIDSLFDPPSPPATTEKQTVGGSVLDDVFGKDDGTPGIVPVTADSFENNIIPGLKDDFDSDVHEFK